MPRVPFHLLLCDFHVLDAPAPALDQDDIITPVQAVDTILYPVRMAQ